MSRIGFDNEKYVRLQSQNIAKRIEDFGGKLYLEFGGKLFDDFHAARVLPGFKADSKVKMLLELKDEAEIVIAISADDIEKSKVRGDFGITYDLDVLRLYDAFQAIGLYVGSVVITHFCGQASALLFEKRLNNLNIRVYKHYLIPDYPANVALIVSDEGFGKNDYIETSRSLVVVTAPGPGSGKMATCLSQLYHEFQRGVVAGYAKFETFPIWNLPLKHPVNLAYEAATVDLNDVNMVDPYHLEAYGVTTVNYNRDVEIFPVLKTIMQRITGESPYKSPTDMGVNMVGYCITDDAVVREASKQEILRRYYNVSCNQRQGLADSSQVYKLELLMNQLGITAEDRPVIQAARQKAEETGDPAVALQLQDGRIITGKTSSLLGASAALLLDATKALAGIPHDVLLLSRIVIEPIQRLKMSYMRSQNPRLHTDEVLIALSICAATNPTAALALEQLPRLAGCEAHSSVILSRVDETMFQRLGVNVTCEPVYQTNKLFHN